jgi:stage II sporulation SpoAA-like protein
VPIIVTVDHIRREVTAVCVGPITLADAMSQLQHETRERGLGYRKFIDTRGSGFEMSLKDARQVAEVLRAISREHWLGPAAVVVSSDAIFETTQQVEKMVQSFCEVRAFRDEKAAREWLASRPI